MPRPPTADLEALLRELSAGGVRFIIVGGAAAVIHGAPITTQDLDIVPDQADDGVARLLAVLQQLDARFRPVRADRDLAPTAEHLAGTGQLNLTTAHGPLDVLLRLHDARAYSALLPHSQEVVAGDLHVRVLDLDALIEIKRATGRARDALTLPLLVAIRDRSKP